MQKIAAILFVFVVCNTWDASAQISARLLSLVDTSSPGLYLGVPNLIKISGLKNGDKVMIDQAEPSGVRADTFTFIPINKSETFRVTRNGHTIFSRQMEMWRCSDPIAKLAGVKGDHASKAQIIEFPRLIVETGNYKNCSQITRFTMHVNGKSSEEIPMDASGNRLTAPQIEAIKPLRIGDKVVFENIIAGCSSCIPRMLEPLIITIQ